MFLVSASMLSLCLGVTVLVFLSGYVFGVFVPERDTGVGLNMVFASGVVMSVFIHLG
jgi:hypothetical protein